jgi:uncharacterized protein YdhG (YjbR/CyaY superfamily)
MPNANITQTVQSGIAAVEAYLAAIPEPARTTLLHVRERIRSAVPQGTIEEMGYGVPSFRGKDRLAGYAAGKKFCSYYPMSGAVITRLESELTMYKTSKGAIQFPLDQPLPAALIRKLIKTRIKDIEARLLAKSNRKHKTT